MTVVSRPANSFFRNRIATSQLAGEVFSFFFIPHPAYSIGIQNREQTNKEINELLFVLY